MSVGDWFHSGVVAVSGSEGYGNEGLDSQQVSSQSRTQQS